MDAERKVLQICPTCWFVHDGQEGVMSSWLTQKAYQDVTGIDPITCRLIPTHCPACHALLFGKSKAA